MPAQRHSQPTSTSLGQGCIRCLGVTCHLHFWQNDRGLLRAIAITRGWNGHRMRVSQHTKLTLKKKVPPPLLPGFELATFRSRVRRANQQAIPALDKTERLFTLPAEYSVLAMPAGSRQQPASERVTAGRGTKSNYADYPTRSAPVISFRSGPNRASINRQNYA